MVFIPMGRGHCGHCYGSVMPRRDPEIPNLVNAKWVARELGIHRSRVHQMIDEEELIGAQVESPTGDGTWVFRPEVVASYKAKRDARRGLVEQPGDAEDDGAQ